MILKPQWLKGLAHNMETLLMDSEANTACSAEGHGLDDALIVPPALVASAYKDRVADGRFTSRPPKRSIGSPDNTK